MRAAVYTRLSRVNERDAQSGATTGVERQAEDAESRCAREGWEVVKVFSDHGLSAWAGRERAQFNALIDLMETGAIDVLVVWKFDRLSRNHKDYARLQSAWTRNGVRVVSIDGVDTSTLAGQLVADMQFAFAHNYSATISYNGKRKQLSLAQEGRMGGRGRRAFGYTPDRSAIIPEEAEHIRDACRDILKGVSLSLIVKRWNAPLENGGVRTSMGNLWSVSTLKQVLTGWHIAGIRSHHGEPVTKAVWDPIIDEATLLAVRRKLQSAPRQGPRRYPLTGLLFCGRCGGKMVGRRGYRDQRGEGGQYACKHATPNTPWCGRMYVASLAVEDYVLERVAAALDGGALARVMDARTGDEAARAMGDLRRAEEGLAELSAMWGANELEREEWRAARAPLLAAKREAQARLDADVERQRFIGMPDSGGALWNAWQAGDVGQRRALVSPLVERIVVDPPTPGVMGFDPDRVSIEWVA